MGKQEKFSSGKMLLIRTPEKILSKIANFIINFFKYFMDSFHAQFPHSYREARRLLEPKYSTFQFRDVKLQKTDLLFY